MTEAPEANPRAADEDIIDESPYCQFHETFAIEPAEAVELDCSKNRLLTVHPHHGIVSNLAIRADDLKVDRCVQTWILTATSLATSPEFVVFITHPYGKLVKADRNGQVLDTYEIWHRYLSNLILVDQFVFVTDRRNDVIMQFDLRNPMTEDTSLLIGRGFLYRPLGACVMSLTYLLVVQNDGRVIVFHLATGFKLTTFAEETPMIGEVSIQCEDANLTVVLGKEMEKCLEVFCLTRYKSKERHSCKVPHFSYALHLSLNFCPYDTVYSPEMQILYVLERRAKERSQVHAFRFNLHLLNHV